MRVHRPLSSLYLIAQESILHISRSSSTSDNLDQLSGNDGLTGSVVENLVFADHLTSVLGGVLIPESA